MHYLYRITNQLSGKVYIGQTTDPKDRWSSHKSSAKNPQKYSAIIPRALSKYGVDNFIFEVIATCRTQEDADVTETELIERYNSRDSERGYNLAHGGSVNRGWHHSEETKKKISESNLGKEMPPHTDEWKANMSAIMTGREITWADKISAAQIGKENSQESRDKMSLAKTGDKHPNYGKTTPNEVKDKISLAHTGKIVSEDTKKKIAQSHVGKSPSEETKKKMSKSMQGKTWTLVDGKRIYSSK